MLYGLPIAEVPPSISPIRFRATIQRHVAEWRDWDLGVGEQRHQAYVRLAMFRSLYGYLYARQISKVAAAEWFRAEFPGWSHEAEQAVEWRHRDGAAIDLAGAWRTEGLVHLVYDKTRD